MSVQAIRFGFTLAEVLITLGIIGVVVALTMPALIANHQKQVTVSALKKFYSAMSQAKILAEQEHGEMSGWDFPTDVNNLQNSQRFFDTYFRKHLNVIKTCTSSSECNLYDGVYPAYILSDGSEFTFNSFSNSGDSAVYVKVDINGNKLPNRDGRDIFHLDIFPENGLVMLGMVEYEAGKEKKILVSREELKNGMLINKNTVPSTACCSSSCSNERYKYLTCGALIQMDGWQIAKDYPW